MTFYQPWLHNFTLLANPLPVYLGDNSTQHAIGYGDINITLPGGQIMIISKVYLVPKLTRNLLSVSELTANGASIEFHHLYCIIKIKLTTGESLEICCLQQSKLYPLGVTTQTSLVQALTTTTSASAQQQTLQWHYQLRHPSAHVLRQMKNHNYAKGLHFGATQIDFYKGCILGKAHHSSFSRSIRSTTSPLQLIHSGLCGPMRTESLTGSKYFLTFIDDYSCFTHVAFLKHNSETHSHFLTYQSLIENQLDHCTHAFRTDNGGAFTSHAFRNHCLAHGIQHQFSIPHTPQQNGIAERKNRTLLNATRSMLTVCGRPHSYWEEAISIACYLQNRTFTTALPNQTPYCRWFGHKPDLSHTRIFGCDAYTVSSDPHRGKLDHKAISTIFVGYGERFGHKAYRLYDPIGRRFPFRRSVIFDELQLLKGNTATFSPTLSSPIDFIHAHDSTPFTKSSSIPLSQPNSNLLHNPSLPLLPLPSPSSSTNDSHNSTFELPTSPSSQASSSSDPLPTPSPSPRMMCSLADIY
ncbi:hypothetical protein L7F22_027779 [Adiantum nelumboides]|nr:hypothetical protein [Adiantum nelumboides]